MAVTQFVLGVDPGLRGGLAWLSPDGRLVACLPMPTMAHEVDAPRLAALLSERLPALAVVERVHSMPKQGVASTFTFGAGWGMVRGILAALQVPTILPAPQVWQRSLNLPALAIPGDSTKDRALAYALARWPGQSWLESPRCRRAHDGMVDAACLAAYGLVRQADRSWLG